MKQKTIIIAVLVILCVAACIALLDTVSSFQGPDNNSTLNNTISHGTPTPSIKTTTKVTAKTTTKVTAKTTTKVTAKTTTVVAAKTTPTAVAYSSAQIYQHLLNIAFSPDTTKINKIDATNEKISVTASYDDNDIATISTFTNQFNSDLSSTTRISEPSIGDQGNIIIHFLPGDSLDSLAADTSYNSLNSKQIINRDENGTICSIYRTISYQTTSSYNIYVNDDLTGDKRDHYILRGLLYYLGFPGESSYPDSMFYSLANANANLSAIDIKAVQLMYGSKIQNGMSVSAIKSMY